MPGTVSSASPGLRSGTSCNNLPLTPPWEAAPGRQGACQLALSLPGICYSADVAPFAGAVVILGNAGWMRNGRNKATSSIASGGPEARRRTSDSMMSNGENAKTKPLYARSCWLLQNAVAFHRRARSAPGSHPSGTVVAKPQSDNCAIHPLSPSERGEKVGRSLKYCRRCVGRSWIASLAVFIAPNHVDHPERRDDVRDHVADQHLVQRTHREETWRPHPRPNQQAAAVADYIEAQLPVGALDRRVGLAGRHLDPFHDELQSGSSAPRWNCRRVP